MPAPALLGASWLGSIIVGAVGSALTYLTTTAARRLALVAAGIVGVLALATAFVTTVEGLVAGLVVSFPTTGGMLALLLPPNLPTALGIVATIETAAWGYRWSTEFIRWKVA